MAYEIIPIRALQDNYIWMIIGPDQKSAVIIDPGEAEPVLKIVKQKNLHLAAVLVTHHHRDHTHGIPELQKKFKNLVIYGPGLKVGEIFIPDLKLNLKILEIPGHTLDQIAFVGLNSVFTGDTLFTAGCGRIFEGTPEQMFASLQKLANLPEDTKVYCGHEYTQNNVRFAKTVEPNNPNFHLQKTAPSTLTIEKLTNPFLRCHIPEVHQSAEKYAGKKLVSGVEVFAVLREWKNNFS